MNSSKKVNMKKKHRKKERKKEKKKERKEQKPKVNLRDSTLMAHLSGNSETFS